MHYTTHGGRLHHYAAGPNLEEQVAGDVSRYVAVGIRAFDDGTIELATEYKPGVARVLVRFGNNLLVVFSRYEFLPPGTPILGEDGKPIDLSAR